MDLPVSQHILFSLVSSWWNFNLLSYSSWGKQDPDTHTRMSHEMWKEKRKNYERKLQFRILEDHQSWNIWLKLFYIWSLLCYWNQLKQSSNWRITQTVWKCLTFELWYKNMLIWGSWKWRPVQIMGQHFCGSWESECLLNLWTPEDQENEGRPVKPADDWNLMTVRGKIYWKTNEDSVTLACWNLSIWASLVHHYGAVTNHGRNRAGGLICSQFCGGVAKG